MKKVISILLAVAMCACILTACGNSAQTTTAAPAGTTAAAAETTAPAAEVKGDPIVITFASFHMESELDTVYFTEPWLEAIETACAEAGYDVTFDRNWGGTLCALPESYQAITDGVADMALFLTAMTGTFELEQALMFSWNGSEIKYPSHLFYDLYQAIPEIQAEYAEVHPIAFLMEPPQKVNSNRLFANMAESAGSLWSSTGAACTAICEEWGWAPNSLGPDEQYSSLERGIVDGVTGTAKTFYSMGWNEVVANRYDNLAMTNQMVSVIMNKDVWESLPAEVQQIFNDFSNGGSWGLEEFYGDAMLEIEAEFEPKLGMNVVTLEQSAVDEFQAGIDTAFGKWAAALDGKGQPGTAIKDKVTELIKKYAK